MFFEWMDKNRTEAALIGIVLIAIFWYYYYVYSEGKTLNDLMGKQTFAKKKVSVPMKKEEFKDNISSHLHELSEESLQRQL